MKKITTIFLAVFLLGACSSNETPSGGGNGGGSISTYIAKDKNGQNLGYVMSANSENIDLVSPKGYFYSINYNGSVLGYSAFISDINTPNINNIGKYTFTTSFLIYLSVFFVSLHQ